MLVPHIEDSILYLCREAEAQARRSGNLAEEFKAGQLEVNTYGLSGNFALAVNKSQQLLDKARACKDPLALGLALQAVGDNYLHTDRYAQADSVFSEAASYIFQNGDDLMRLQLLLQQLHVYVIKEKSDRMPQTQNQARELLEASQTIPDSEKAFYRFLLKGYQTSCSLFNCNMERAKVAYDELLELRPAGGEYDLWFSYIAMRYYLCAKEYDKALAYSDSTMQAAQASRNGAILRNVLHARAELYEQIGDAKEACALYRQIAVQSDSLYRRRYTSQIDSLHVIFWTDQLQMSYITRRNTLYGWLIGGLFVLVAVAGVVGIFIRRKNRQLKDSRLKLEQMREASADAIRTKSLFLSNMSHELRTPLNAITGFATLLADHTDIDDQTKQQCGGFIRQNADLLMKLIGDVSDFSALQGDAITFSFAMCDVVGVCRNTVSTINNVKRTAATLHFESDLERLEMVADKNRLQQVLINLLINATKFTSEGKITLRLNTDPERDEAVFVVEDTGCGIPLEKQPAIFERFEKLHEGVQGAGLGLSICKLIIEHNGGRIWIDSAYQSGARFVFTHPLHLKAPCAQK